VALVSAQAGIALFSFAAVWLATRLLGPAGYGWIVGIIAASQAIAQLTIVWTSYSVSRFGVEEFVATGNVAAAFWTRFWVLIPNLVLVIATAPLWLPSISGLLKLPPGANLLIIGNFLAASLWGHIQQALQGAKLMRRQASLLMFERLIVFGVIALCAVSGTASWIVIATAYIFGPIGAGSLGLWKLRAHIFPVRWMDRALLARMLRFSWPMLPASLVGYLSTNYLDAFFITHYLSGAHLGVYAVAYQLSGMALQLPLLAGSLLMPLFVTLQVDGQEDRAKRFLTDVLPLLALLWGALCAVAATAGSFFFPLIFGHNFQTLDTLLWPLMAATAVVAPVLMGYAPFSSSRSVTYIAMIGAVVAAVINVLLDYLLIPRFGLVGCAWATTLAYAMNMLVVVYMVHWRLRVPRTWTIWSVVPMLAGAVCASLLGVSIRALGVTLILTVILLLFHRRAVSPALKLLENFWRGRTSASQLA